MVVLYSRPGHRVLVNSRGDMIVRPSWVEASLQKLPGGAASLPPSPVVTVEMVKKMRNHKLCHHFNSDTTCGYASFSFASYR